MKMIFSILVLSLVGFSASAKTTCAAVCGLTDTKQIKEAYTRPLVGNSYAELQKQCVDLKGNVLISTKVSFSYGAIAFDRSMMVSEQTACDIKQEVIEASKIAEDSEAARTKSAESCIGFPCPAY